MSFVEILREEANKKFQWPDYYKYIINKSFYESKMGYTEVTVLVKLDEEDLDELKMQLEQDGFKVSTYQYLSYMPVSLTISWE